MLNHLHLVIEAARLASVRWELATELRAFTRCHFPGRRIWQEVGATDPLPDLHHLRRNIRYVHLNPCRAGLVADPIEWEWSTHRDYLGAAYPSWVNPSTLGRLWKGGKEEFHRYVSGDPSTRVQGTPMLVPPAPGAVYSLEAIMRAVTIATHGWDAPSIESRKWVVQLADELARATRGELAGALGVTTRTIHRIAAGPVGAEDRRAMEVVRKVLADQRLMAWREDGEPLRRGSR
jgi:hypothetical protein